MTHLMIGRGVNDSVCPQILQQLCLAFPSSHRYYLGTQDL